jgi:hypothetical protein
MRKMGMMLKTILFISMLTAANGHFFMDSFESQSSKKININHVEKDPLDKEVVAYLDLRKSILDIYDYLEQKRIYRRNLLTRHIRDLADHNIANMSDARNLDQFTKILKKNSVFKKTPQIRQQWVLNRINDLKTFTQNKSLDLQAKVDAHLNGQFIPSEQITEKVTKKYSPNWMKINLIALGNFIVIGLFLWWNTRRRKTVAVEPEHVKEKRSNKEKVIDILSEEVKDIIISNNLNLNFSNTKKIALFRGHHMNYLLNESIALLSELPTDSHQIYVNNNDLNNISISIPISHIESLTENNSFMTELTVELNALTSIALKVERRMKVKLNQDAKNVIIKIEHESSDQVFDREIEKMRSTP